MDFSLRAQRSRLRLAPWDSYGGSEDSATIRLIAPKKRNRRQVEFSRDQAISGVRTGCEKVGRCEGFAPSARPPARTGIDPYPPLWQYFPMACKWLWQ
jgi:hypothetical protein